MRVPIRPVAHIPNPPEACVDINLDGKDELLITNMVGTCRREAAPRTSFSLTEAGYAASAEASVSL